MLHTGSLRGKGPWFFSGGVEAAATKIPVLSMEPEAELAG